MKKIFHWFTTNVLYFAWLQAVVGMLVSLYFSDVLRFPPCDLCWYQRILLYPLVILIAVGIVRKDRHLASYVLPFSIGGAAVAFYHYLLQMSIIPKDLAPCTTGVSCSTPEFLLLGFINIPLLSFLAFGFLTACMVLFKKHSSRIF